MRVTSLDHVALWVAERDELASFLCERLGMHEIERTDSFTLCGVDAKLGKLTLFDAEGPRERGVLERVLLRVEDLEAAASALDVEGGRSDGQLLFDAPAGLPLGLVEASGTDYDLHAVVLRVPDPAGSGERLAELGFEHHGGGSPERLSVADRFVRLVPGDPGDGERPLLNHLALLVDSAAESQAEIERLGMTVDDLKDAPNTLAVFVTGPDGVRVEYVEHKPGFSLV